MNAQFDHGRDLPGAASRKNEDPLKRNTETRKTTQDSRHVGAGTATEPPFQFGEWIEGNVGQRETGR